MIMEKWFAATFFVFFLVLGRWGYAAVTGMAFVIMHVLSRKPRGKGDD